MKRILILPALVLAAGCSNPAEPAVATLKFRMESPFCGPTRKFALTFFIDQAIVGAVSLSDGQTSRVFSTTPGNHHLSATAPGLMLTGDTTVVLKADTTFTSRVNAYCS